MPSLSVQRSTTFVQSSAPAEPQGLNKDHSSASCAHLIGGEIALSNWFLLLHTVSIMM